MNVTMKKFGYPQTLIKEFKKWVIVLRPQQVTLGSLILICQDDAKAFSDISPEAFSELPQVIKEIESSLSKAFSYQKINYLMLMMVDQAADVVSAAITKKIRPFAPMCRLKSTMPCARRANSEARPAWVAIRAKSSRRDAARRTTPTSQIIRPLPTITKPITPISARSSRASLWACEKTFV